MIPLVHDVRDETVLIFGGGRVGARRARTFEDARVIVVSPAFADVEFDGAELVRAEPDPTDVRDWIDRTRPVLTVAATDDGTFNATVAEAAEEAGVLVNRADRSAAGTGGVDVPAIVRDGPVVASVSTSGTSPALSAHLRERMETVLAGSGAVATATARIRSDLRERGIPGAQRRRAMRAVVNGDAVWRAAREGDDVSSVAKSVVERVLADEDPESTGR